MPVRISTAMPDVVAKRLHLQGIGNPVRVFVRLRAELADSIIALGAKPDYQATG